MRANTCKDGPPSTVHACKQRQLGRQHRLIVCKDLDASDCRVTTNVFNASQVGGVVRIFFQSRYATWWDQISVQNAVTCALSSDENQWEPLTSRPTPPLLGGTEGSAPCWSALDRSGPSSGYLEIFVSAAPSPPPNAQTGRLSGTGPHLPPNRTTHRAIHAGAAICRGPSPTVDGTLGPPPLS